MRCRVSEPLLPLLLLLALQLWTSLSSRHQIIQNSPKVHKVLSSGFVDKVTAAAELRNPDCWLRDMRYRRKRVSFWQERAQLLCGWYQLQHGQTPNSKTHESSLTFGFCPVTCRTCSYHIQTNNHSWLPAKCNFPAGTTSSIETKLSIL